MLSEQIVDVMKSITNYTTYLQALSFPHLSHIKLTLLPEPLVYLNVSFMSLKYFIIFGCL